MAVIIGIHGKIVRLEWGEMCKTSETWDVLYMLELFTVVVEIYPSSQCSPETSPQVASPGYERESRTVSHLESTPGTSVQGHFMELRIDCLPWLSRSGRWPCFPQLHREHLDNRNCKVNLFKHSHLMESSSPILFWLLALCLFILAPSCPPRAQRSTVIRNNEIYVPPFSSAHSGNINLRYNTLELLWSHFKLFLYWITFCHYCLSVEWNEKGGRGESTYVFGLSLWNEILSVL